MINIASGSKVFCKGQNYEILHVLDLEAVLAKAGDGKQKVLKIAELEPPRIDEGTKADKSPKNVNLEAIPNKDWKVAEQRMEVIKPLLSTSPRTREDVEKHALKTGIHAATLYRWISRYEFEGKLTALLPNKRGVKRGARYLNESVEAIIDAVINGEYMDEQKITSQEACNKIIDRCKCAGLNPPHPNTIRNRIEKIDGHKRIRRRNGAKAARAYDPIQGPFPNADWPLAFVEIDHTNLDIILVDDIDRQPVGRPTITLGTDNCSRVVTGFHVSFDPPSALAVGLCVAHSVLPKEDWLQKHGVTGEWPVWGIMNCIHVDNAKEFRGKALKKACDEYGIRLEWRPVGRPNFGGHVERLLGTIAKEIHALPGTTFSNSKERGEYKSESKAVMTLHELETWLTEYICNVYHKRLHSMINMSPLQKYREGIMGAGDTGGTGIPPRFAGDAAEKFRLDFLPFEMRTVQNYGISLNNVQYYSDVLNRWIHAVEPGRYKEKKKFMIRYDPRDISSVYFWDPEVQEYFRIPYRNTTRPPISVWELRAIRAKLLTEGRKNIDENDIFEARERMRKMQLDAKQKTKTARRLEQRERTHKMQRERENLIKDNINVNSFPGLVDLCELQPFEEEDIG